VEGRDNIAQVALDRIELLAARDVCEAESEGFAKMLNRVNEALDVCEAERDRAVALVRDALDALDHDDCWVTSEEARLLASVSIEETNE
jgi:hypothetical protein